MADLLTPYSTRLCLSGVESRRLLDTFKDFGVNHIQVSYYYLRRVFDNPLDFEAYIKDFKTVIIDSGTVYGNIKNEDQKAALLSDYAGYLGALDKKLITAAVYEGGHNIDSILPDEMLIYPLDDIYDLYDGDIENVLSNTKYLGLSNKYCSYKGGENLPRIFRAAEKSGSYIHAFGTSSRKILTRHPFYSANTSSWRSGSRYLNTYIYQGPGRGLRLFQPTDKSDKVKSDRETKVIRKRQDNMVKVRQAHLYDKVDWGGVYEGDPWEVDKGNLTQWIIYQQDMELFNHQRYFLNEKERQDILYRKRALLSNSNLGAFNRESPPIEDAPGTEKPIENMDSQTANIEGNIKEADIEEPVIEGEIVEDSDNMQGDILPSNENSSISHVSSTASEQLIPHKNAENKGRSHPVDPRMRILRQCDFCSLAGRCPKYSAGNDCAYGFGPEHEDPTPDNLPDVIKTQFMDNLVILGDSIQQLALEERLDGAGANKDLTQRMKLWADMVQQMAEAMDTRDEVSLKAKGHGILNSFMDSKTRGH